MLTTTAAVSPAPLSPALLKTKPHYEVLDGLRGVAAIIVVIFHFMEFAVPDYSKSFVGHGFLAVDFFFCLSGFVIGYAYDDRMPAIGVKGFLEARLIRLQPLVVFGSVLGLLLLFVDPFVAHLPNFGAGRVTMVFLTSIFLIPYPVMPEKELNLFSLNAPAWSLFWEYLANIAYAFFLVRLRHRTLLLLTGVAALILCLVGFHTGTLSVGWGGPTFFYGAARVFFSFLVGLLLYRSGWRIASPLGFTGLSVLLLAALMMPYFPGNWIFELVVVLLYLPLLIALDAGTTLTRTSEKLCVFSGNISYPLYMIHYGVIWIFASYLEHRHPSTITTALVIAASVLMLILFAWLVLTFYDAPVRRFLRLRRAAQLTARA